MVTAELAGPPEYQAHLVSVDTLVSVVIQVPPGRVVLVVTQVPLVRQVTAHQGIQVSVGTLVLALLDIAVSVAIAGRLVFLVRVAIQVYRATLVKAQADIRVQVRVVIQVYQAIQVTLA